MIKINYKQCLIFISLVLFIFSVSSVSAEDIALDNTISLDEVNINENIEFNNINDYGNDRIVGVSDYKEIYFNASASEDGDGSINNPYKVFDASRLTSNTIAYFANGEYDLLSSKYLNNVVFIGQDCEKTIIKGHENYGFTVLEGARFTIKDLTYIRPDIVNEGTLTVNNAILKEGVAPKDDYNNSIGGAIVNYDEYSEIYIINSTFIANIADFGGSLYNNGGYISIRNSKFINGSSYSYGGVIANEERGTVDILDSYFINCTSKDDAGGAIYSRTGYLTIKDSYFINCSANFGAAITGLVTYVNINNTEFKNNKAKFEGGAIFHMYSKLQIESSSFYNNSALNGGAIFSDNTTSFVLISSKFADNSAFNGLNIYLSDNNNFINRNNGLKSSEIFKISNLNIQIGSSNYTIFKNDGTYNGTLPSRYNLVENGYVSPIKDQQEGGNCWAFAALATLESAILKASNLTYDLSEENMKNLAEIYSKYGFNRETNNGGWDKMALGYLTSWLGPVNESDDKYDDYSTLSAVFNSILHVQNIYYVPDRKNPNDNDKLKEAIIKYGAVNSPIYYDANYYNSYSSSYYYNGANSGANHAVSIVGWDDNYSKYKFSITAPGNGAFIVKNSWNTEWGDNGYFYVSYYDSVFAKTSEVGKLYTFLFNDTTRYNKNYQYDLAGLTDHFIVNGSTVWIKNSFNSTGDDMLAAFSTYFSKQTNFTAKIYVNNVLETVKNGSMNAGYYTIQLDKFIPLKVGDIFDIELQLTSSDDVDFAVCEKISTSRVTYAPGVSFVSFDGKKWYDLYKFSYSYANHEFSSQVACIKAFTTGKLNTVVLFDNVVVNEGQATIVASIKDELGHLINEGIITFSIEGSYYNVSLIDGKVTLNHNFTTTGTHNIYACYIGDKYYEKSVNTTIIKVDKLVANLTIDCNDIEYGNDLIINFSVSNKELFNESFVISFNNTKQVIGLKNGSYSLVIKNLSAGNYNMSATFNGNKYYFNQTVTKTVVVKKADIDLDLSFDNVYWGQNPIVIIKSTNSFNIPLNLTIGVNSHVIDIKNGYAQIKLDKQDIGNYTVIFSVNGTDNYNGFSAKKFMEIVPMKTILHAKNISMYYKDGSRYEILLSDIEGKPLSNMSIIITVNGVSYSKITDKDGKLSMNLNLNSGIYKIITYYCGDGNYKNTSITNNITVLPTIHGADIVKYFRNGTQYSASFIDANGNPLANSNVTFNINGVFYYKTTDENGTATLNINLNTGHYILTATNPINGEMHSNTVTVLPSISGNDIIKYFRNGTQYYAKFFNNDGSSLVNANVTFNINGVFYHKITDENGIAKLNINLNPGKYILTAINPLNGEMCSNEINVLPVLTGKDLNMIFHDGSSYQIKLIDGNGNPLPKANITFNINGVLYNKITDGNGITSLAINLIPGKYIITSKYDDISISNIITVKS